MRSHLRLVVFALVVIVPTAARADVDVETTELRNYQLPGAFDLANARVLQGAGGSTVISATVGTSPEEAACGVVVATEQGATLFEYRYDQRPSSCNGVLPHPDGGFFLRGADPSAMEGQVTGFTAYVDGEGQEQWSISDQDLVDAQPEPNGTGEFQGEYAGPHPSMAYSQKLDKLLAFTVGNLNIGLDQKSISQAHVVNVGSGSLQVSGQTFGQSGVGIVGGTTTRPTDGYFLIYYFSVGDQGAFFYRYNGRENIAFFKPRGEDWDTRFVLRMLYERELLHLLWTADDSETAQTRVTVTNDDGAELWSQTWESDYVLADGTPVALGRPLSMWVSADWTVVLYQSQMQFYLRAVDINGNSLGVAPLAESTEFPPIAIVNGTDDRLKMLTYDMPNRRVYEHWLDFEDVDDFDPDMGISDGGFEIPEDASLPADIGVRDVLEASGCCATVSTDRRRVPWPIAGLVVAVAFARRARSQR